MSLSADKRSPGQMTSQFLSRVRSAGLARRERLEPLEVAGALVRGEGPGNSDPVDEDHVQNADQDELELLPAQGCREEVDGGGEQEVPAEEGIGAGPGKALAELHGDALPPTLRLMKHL